MNHEEIAACHVEVLHHLRNSRTQCSEALESSEIRTDSIHNAVIPKEFATHIPSRKQSRGLLFLPHGPFLSDRGLGTCSCCSPGPSSASRGVWRHISPSPRVLPPLPPSRCQIGSGKGGKDPGGRNNMPSDSPPMGVVNSPQTTALQNVAVVNS